jgi:hypothetical protein
LRNHQKQQEEEQKQEKIRRKNLKKQSTGSTPIKSPDKKDITPTDKWENIFYQ